MYSLHPVFHVMALTTLTLEFIMSTNQPFKVYLGERCGFQNQPLRVYFGWGSILLTSSFQFSSQSWNDSFHSKGSYSSLALGNLLLTAAVLGLVGGGKGFRTTHLGFIWGGEHSAHIIISIFFEKLERLIPH